ncbi:IS630 family transposase [Spirosoma sp. BT702]|uniref:IS630 family transposase n=1 Tax=Spirosoma profusum TaxID=2771354 RepID=A0A927GAV2_9BACT|nr:IS630 family transposase [Spirosoma profusum]MBD2705698.1 IS630 family transposase [Spirosoma profusum]
MICKRWLLKAISNGPPSRLFYGDESGFSLIPVVPYGWQVAGHSLERPSQSSRRFNVLAWLNQAGELVSFTSPVSINSRFVIGCVDEWVSSLTGPTVLVLDNAPMHRSKSFRACFERWQQAGLYVFFLPAYSPHLNKAECLWRKIKYEWLDTAAYASYEALTQAVKSILAEFGHKYTIQFAQNHCTINSV